jgi:hypothetical protein
MAEQWKIEGEYFDSCSCNVGCPCQFGSDPTLGYCDHVVVWHIKNGNYGDVRIDGLNVVLAGHLPGHPFKGHWTLALYVDERASEQQREALTTIYGGQAGGIFGNLAALIENVVGVKYVPIDVKIDGRKRSVTIPNILDVDMEALTNPAMPDKEVQVVNGIWTEAPGFPQVQGKSSKSKYKDFEWDFDFSEKSSRYAPFEYAGP